MKLSIAHLLLLALAVSSACAQTQPSASTWQGQTEVAGEYTWVHSNAPPAECGCFSLNGGSGEIARTFYSGYSAFVFDTTVVHAAGISPAGYDLTLSVFTAGYRFRPAPHERWNPYGQVLLGGEHASGTLVQGNTPAASDPGVVFAMNIGGGIDRRLGDHWWLRLVDADYMMTSTSNRTNDLQNNVRISTGLVYRFGHSHP
ncbi:outer membrane beta-barrel protein [Silvibacterium sp.]|uniref:outer membrane beta-barrel protein n=1 Tax=Silvibacterium sp. TaxID=1964179 RepID=UPI0039E65CA5